MTVTMSISWCKLVNWMTGPWKLPVGFSLEYDSLPRGGNYVDKTCIPDWWKLSAEELDKAQQEIIRARNTRFNKAVANYPGNFCWQRFTLTDINGKEFILQMDSQGRVQQLKRVEVTQTFERLVTV